MRRVDHIDPPDRAAWEARRIWFETAGEPHPHANCMLSEQACALRANVQSAFCTRA